MRMVKGMVKWWGRFWAGMPWRWRRPWPVLVYGMVCLAALVVGQSDWHPVTAQGPGGGSPGSGGPGGGGETIPDDIVSETKQVPIGNGQTATVTFSFNFTKCEWKLETSAHPVLRVEIASGPYPAYQFSAGSGTGSLPTGWQPVNSLACTASVSHGVVLNLEYGTEEVYVGRVVSSLFSERTLRVSEYRLEAVLPVTADADGKKHVFPGDPVRLRYAFTRTVPPELNMHWRILEQDYPVPESGRGELITRLPRYHFGAQVDPPPPSLSLRINFPPGSGPDAQRIPVPVIKPAPEADLLFDRGGQWPYYWLPTGEAVYVQPVTVTYLNHPEVFQSNIVTDLVRGTDCPPPGAPPATGPSLELLSGSPGQIRVLNGSPVDMLVTLNKGEVMSAQRLGVLLGNNPSQSIPLDDLWFAAGGGPYHVAVLRVDGDRPFTGQTLEVTSQVAPLYPTPQLPPLPPPPLPPSPPIIEFGAWTCPFAPGNSPVYINYQYPPFPSAEDTAAFVPPSDPPEPGAPVVIMVPKVYDFTEPFEYYVYSVGGGWQRRVGLQWPFLRPEALWESQLGIDWRKPIYHGRLGLFDSDPLKLHLFSWGRSLPPPIFRYLPARTHLFARGKGEELPCEPGIGAILNPAPETGPDISVRFYFPYGKTPLGIKSAILNNSLAPPAFLSGGSRYGIFHVYQDVEVYTAYRGSSPSGNSPDIYASIIETDDGKRAFGLYPHMAGGDPSRECPPVSVPVTVTPPRVPADRESQVQVTIPGGFPFLYGIIQGGKEPVVFERPGTYTITIAPGVNRRPIRVSFHGSGNGDGTSCPASVTEVMLERDPLTPRGWIIAADTSFPGAPGRGDGPYDPGIYWQGPSYVDGLPNLKDVSVAYQKRYGSQAAPLPPPPGRKGTVFLTEGPSMGTRQRDW